MKTATSTMRKDARKLESKKLTAQLHIVMQKSEVIAVIISKEFSFSRVSSLKKGVTFQKLKRRHQYAEYESC